MTNPIPSTTALLPTMTQTKPTKIEDAAKQFEALLIGQMLRSVRDAAADDNPDADVIGQPMLDVADQQFAKLLAHNGGMGLARVVVSGLTKESK
jgi:peptidoglycan hydrolase FlgJ